MQVSGHHKITFPEHLIGAEEHHHSQHVREGMITPSNLKIYCTCVLIGPLPLVPGPTALLN